MSYTRLCIYEFKKEGFIAAFLGRYRVSSKYQLKCYHKLHKIFLDINLPMPEGIEPARMDNAAGQRTRENHFTN